MFLIFSKEKIFTYVVSISTVIVLFLVSSNIQIFNKKIIETSTNIERLLPIYKVKTQKKEVALTMNCAWS